MFINQNKQLEIKESHNENSKIIRNHVIKKFTEAKVNNEPYPYIVIDDFFPREFARKIDNLFPTPDNTFFDSNSIHNTQKRYRRSFFNGEPNRTSLELTLDAVLDLDLLKCILKKYSIEYNSNYAWGAHYAIDYGIGGCSSLSPHVDVKSKVVSLVYYVPSTRYVDGKLFTEEIPGTDILIRDNNKNFHEHTCIDAKKNRCLSFPRTENSWHAVKETKHLRRTLTMFIVDRSKVTTFSFLK